MRYQIRDGVRLLDLDGQLLATATSEKAGSQRWVEFSLYRSRNGIYVVGRIGKSCVFHRGSCSIVRRNHLPSCPGAGLGNHVHPCEECKPTSKDEEVYPERDRPWAQKCETPEGVLESLYSDDEIGTRYLTLVARRLLEEAGKLDPLIDAVYRVETIA